MSKPKLLIGVDPGNNTGIAFWYPEEQNLVPYQFKTHVAAILYIHSIEEYLASYQVVFKIEDARKYIKRPGRLDAKNMEKQQGVGSVKARSKDWEEFCLLKGYNHILCEPRHTPYKNSPELFMKLTGLSTLITQDHVRDACMLVYGY